jgi:hypothetical protein
MCRRCTVAACWLPGSMDIPRARIQHPTWHFLMDSRRGQTASLRLRLPDPPFRRLLPFHTNFFSSPRHLCVHLLLAKSSAQQEEPSHYPTSPSLPPSPSSEERQRLHSVACLTVQFHLVGVRGPVSRSSWPPPSMSARRLLDLRQRP